MQGFLEFTEEKKIIVKTKMGGEIPATIKVTGKDYHIVKTDSGKQYKVDHQGNSLEEEIEIDESEYDYKKAMKSDNPRIQKKGIGGAMDAAVKRIKQTIKDVPLNSLEKPYKEETNKDLPFTPDAKKTKPSTPGKYGDAYSTVRNLARKALEKQKQVKEEEQLDEKSAQARANKARKNVMDAGRGAAYRQKTGVNLDPKTDGYPSQQAMNKALGRQLRREELDLQEAKSKQELQSLMRKHEQHAIDANKRGDDAAAVKHQNYINSVKKKLEQVVRNEEVELEEGHVPDDHGRVLSQSDKEKLGKVADLMSKEKVAKQKQVKETAPVAPSLGVHRIQVTVSDPDHTMVSQRKEKVQKFVRVTSNSKENALERGKKHFAKKGWKVHDAEHVGMVHEEVDLEESKKGYAPGWMLKSDPELAKKVKANTQGYKDLKKYAGKDIPKKEVAEGYRGSSKADEPYWEAEAHKKEAEKARKSGDNFSYHKFMSAHHDALSQWNANKGRHHVADQHATKADNHEDWAQEARKEKK